MVGGRGADDTIAHIKSLTGKSLDAVSPFQIAKNAGRWYSNRCCRTCRCCCRGTFIRYSSLLLDDHGQSPLTYGWWSLGVFLVLDLAAIYILTRRRRYSRPNIPMILAGVVMLFLSTAQFIVDATNLFMAFIPLNRVARIAFFSDLTHPIFAAKHAIYFTMMLVGDAIVVS